MKILIGIVLFHPDPDRFRQNMEALAPQLSPDMTLAFADNGTDNAEKQRILREFARDTAGFPCVCEKNRLQN